MKRYTTPAVDVKSKLAVNVAMTHIQYSALMDRPDGSQLRKPNKTVVARQIPAQSRIRLGYPFTQAPPRYWGPQSNVFLPESKAELGHVFNEIAAGMTRQRTVHIFWRPDAPTLIRNSLVYGVIAGFLARTSARVRRVYFSESYVPAHWEVRPIRSSSR